MKFERGQCSSHDTCVRELSTDRSVIVCVMHYLKSRNSLNGSLKVAVSVRTRVVASTLDN